MQLTLLLATAALTTAAPLPGLLDGLTSKLSVLKDTLSNNAVGTSVGDTGNIGQVLGDIDSTISEIGNVNTGDITGVGEINAPVTVGDVASGNSVQLSDFLKQLLGDVDISDVVSGLGLDASDLTGLDLGDVMTLSGFASALGVSVQDLVSVLTALGIDAGSGF